MSTNKLDETLESLGIGAGDSIREQVISRSMNNLKERVSKMDIHVEKTQNENAQVEATPHYNKLELAEVATKVYKDNIKSKDRADKIDDVIEKDPSGKEQPSTIASRANVRALSRSLAGMRTSGNEGKTSPVGPNGTGNLGKLSPSGDNGVGNVTNNYNNYYALTTDMTLEEYELYVNNLFEGEDCGCEHEKKAEKTKKEIKARGGPPGYPDKTKKEDVVYELEDRLITLGSTDWIQVDQVLREFARELDTTPRTLSREFKSVHGQYPDKWIKENLDVEVCGYMPLEEATRLNKCGGVYEVTFMFRGGTNRLKFFWPSPGTPSKEDMQNEVEKFWPKAKLIAFYPSIDNLEQGNFMVMAPPVTENYYFLQPDVWTELTEETSEILDIIYSEEGEPISPILNEESGYSVFIEDHDSGEQRQVFFDEGSLHDWFGKSKSKGGKPGWVQSDGSPCANEEGETGTPKCYSSKRLAGLKKSESGKKKIRSADARKSAKDSGQQSKSGGAKPTMVRTFTDKDDYKKHSSGDGKSKNEEVQYELDEAKDKKGSGSGSKDACYHKVKSRYSVWPSAYASGALVKCRRAGASNWGNSSKKEEVEYVDEALTGGRQKRARDMKGTPYQKGGGPRTSRDNVTLHNLADRSDGPGTPDYEKKSTGGKGGGKYAGYGDQGAGNKARRRMGQDPIRKRERSPGSYGLKEGAMDDDKGGADRIQLNPGGQKGKSEEKHQNDGVGAKAGAPADPRSARKKAKDEKEQASIATKAKKADPANKAKEDALKKALGPERYAAYKAKQQNEEYVDEACWKGYEKKGMKTMFGKKYPNCVKKEEAEYVGEDRKSGQYGGKYGGYGYSSPEDEKKQTDEIKRLNKIALDKRRAKKEEVEYVQEVAPLIAGLAGKAAGALAGKAATGAAAKAGGGIAKAAGSKMGQKAIQGGANYVGGKVEDKLSDKDD